MICKCFSFFVLFLVLNVADAEMKQRQQQQQQQSFEKRNNVIDEEDSFQSAISSSSSSFDNSDNKEPFVPFDIDLAMFEKPKFQSLFFFSGHCDDIIISRINLFLSTFIRNRSICAVIFSGIM